MGDPSVWTRQLPAHTRPHSLGIVCADVVGSRACDGASPLPGTGTSRRRRSHTLAATGCTLDWLAHSCCGHVCWGLQHGVLPFVQYGAYGLASPPPIPPSAARSTGSCIVLHVTLQRSSLLESPETLLLRRWHDDSLASPDVEMYARRSSRNGHRLPSLGRSEVGELRCSRGRDAACPSAESAVRSPPRSQ